MFNRRIEIPLRKMVTIALACCLSFLGGPLNAESKGIAPKSSPISFLTTPLSFEANVGQVEPGVHYLSRGPGYGVFLTPTEAVLVLQRPTAPTSLEAITGRSDPPAPSLQEATLRFHFLGTQQGTSLPRGRDQLPGQSHYFLGNDPTQWHTQVPHYARVVYEGIYPGIDLIYYGREGQLEYDLIVAPGANPQEILLEIQGAERVTLLPDGALSIETSAGALRHQKPVIYQERDGVKQVIPGAYRLREGNQVSFEIAAYDSTHPLFIDPVLTYSSYFESDGVYSVAFDENGNLYLTGAAIPSLPIRGGVQKSSNGFLDAFVTKFDPTGTSLLYSTFLGGSLDDQGRDIAVDSLGNAHVVGISSSSDFPMAKPIQSENAGAYDMFLAKLSPTGARLEYSTYLGGVGNDGWIGGLALALDEESNVYLNGSTNSPDFPSVKAFQTEYGGAVDAFVAKVGGAGPEIIFSTFLGGFNSDFGGDVAIDVAVGDEEEEPHIYVVGTTLSVDFPLEAPFQPQLLGGSDIFVTKFNPDGSGLVYSTYLGGEEIEEGRGLAVNRRGQVYITGNTQSEDFPVKRPLQEKLAGDTDIIISHFDSDATVLRYSTYFGGTNDELALGLAVDGNLEAWVTGGTLSDNFPVTATAPQQTRGMGGLDAFVIRLSSGGRSLEYASYLGGDGEDVGRTIAVMTEENDLTNAFVGGTTTSSDFPRTSPSQAVPSSGFVAKLMDTNTPEQILQADLAITMSDAPEPVERGARLTYTVTVTNQGPNTATGVTVTDKVPARLRLTGASASQGACRREPLECDLGTVGVGTQVVLTITGIPLAGPVTLTNSASVLSNLPDPNVSNNSVTVFSDVTAPAGGSMADLSIVKTDDPDPATVGVPFTYILTIENRGPDTARNVIVTDTLPQGVSLGSATLTQGTCTGFRELVCELGSLESESKATITLSVISTNVGDLSNTAVVTSSTTDPELRDNVIDESTKAEIPPSAELADVLIALSLDGGPLNPEISSGRATKNWKMAVSNGGPDIAIDVKAISLIEVQDIPGIPPTTIEHLEIFTPMKGVQGEEVDPLECPSCTECTTCKCTSCMGSGCTESVSNITPLLEENILVLTCDIGNLLFNEKFTVDFSAELTQGVHFNTVGVTTLTFDPEPSNDETTASTTVAVTPGGPPRGNVGGDDGGCFIATAAFGSPLAGEVELLRRFRDQYLLPSPAGQLLVQAYYFSSPPLAAFISQHPGLKAFIRGGLLPVIWWADLTLKSPFLGFAVVFGVLLIISSLFYWILRTRRYQNGVFLWRSR